MATSGERISVLETKVENIETKIDDLRTDLRTDNTELKQQLSTMYEASCSQHSELAKKITDLEQFKNKWVWTAAGAVALLGFITGHSDFIIKFLK
jgi:SMC interacting uncharacterized protein involved in chromosome segregation